MLVRVIAASGLRAPFTKVTFKMTFEGVAAAFGRRHPLERHFRSHFWVKKVTLGVKQSLEKSLLESLLDRASRKSHLKSHF